ncbi:1,4-beta-xylanase [Streptomyces sp. WAC 01325]|uniref:ThuA domain-containing protein n=1 Tax=Streptomyces sp. WAC 01325 TaxID=2203202 RepID=UPI000F880982|nr:ThuA domain-containing protein [Streptomyces sp. WAC 01325]RSM97470.1 1,4-beta-xylanase [Streptomyces sp. WAC 01325]
MRYRNLAGAAVVVGAALLSAACTGGANLGSVSEKGKPGATSEDKSERILNGDAPAPGSGSSEGGDKAGHFNVIAFYNGNYDSAHISFDHEANAWFEQVGRKNGFTYTTTKDWSKLNSANLDKYQVVMFLDGYPHAASQQRAFETYMNDGGGFIGFHVAAYNEDPNDWPWYHHTFLGTGKFRGNTWGPTSEKLKIENTEHAVTAGLPGTIESSVSEWYSWQNDLRKNRSIEILASLDPSTFPIGSNPSETWYRGYYPIVWSHRTFKMVYNNFGHNAMNYSANTKLSSTFASNHQNRLLLQQVQWAAGSSNPATPSEGATNALHGYGGKCVAVAGPHSTALQLDDCDGTDAQIWTVNRTGTFTALGKCMDVTEAGTYDGAEVRMQQCDGNASQIWRRGPNGSLVNSKAGKCLDATGPSSASGTLLQMWSCSGGANQNWTLPS